MSIFERSNRFDVLSVKGDRISILTKLRLIWMKRSKTQIASTRFTRGYLESFEFDDVELNQRILLFLVAISEINS